MNALASLAAMGADGLWIVLAGGLVGSACALAGSLLVLRRQAMLGDAVGHAALFGIVVAYLFSGSRQAALMLPAAALTGLVVAAGSDWMSHRLRLKPDATLGILYTVLFAAAVILIARYARQTDLDAQCVLFGEIGYLPLDRLLLGGLDLGPTGFWALLAATALAAAAVLPLHRGWRATSFDPIHARLSGLHTGRWRLGMAALAASVAAASFDAVGSIMVVALLVGPATVGLLQARTLAGVWVIGVGVAWLAATGGYALAIGLDASIGAAMALIAALAVPLALISRTMLQFLGRPGRSGPRQTAREQADPITTPAHPAVTVPNHAARAARR